MDTNARLIEAARLHQQGQFDSALGILRDVVRQEPTQKIGWWGIASITQDLTEKNKALNEVLELDPQHEQAHRMLMKLNAAEAKKERHPVSETTGASNSNSATTGPTVGHEATKKCPFCAETIKAEAIICRYCGKELLNQPKPRWTNHPPSTRSKKFRKLVPIFLSIFVVCSLVTLFSLLLTNRIGLVEIYTTDQDKLIGKWEPEKLEGEAEVFSAGGNYSMEFFQDGTITVESNSNLETFEYKIVSPTQIQIIDGRDRYIEDYSVSKNTLIIDTGPETVHLNRVSPALFFIDLTFLDTSPSDPTPTNDDLIVGTWETSSNMLGLSGQFQFRRDGVVLLTGFLVKAEGTYEVIDDAHVQIEWSGDWQASSGIYTITIDHDEMTLTFPGATETNYLTRIR